MPAGTGIDGHRWRADLTQAHVLDKVKQLKAVGTAWPPRTGLAVPVDALASASPYEVSDSTYHAILAGVAETRRVRRMIMRLKAALLVGVLVPVLAGLATSSVS